MATLNTMFKENANATFNNMAFSSRIIARMEDKQAKSLSDQVQRLYLAAKALKKTSGKSAVARLLNVAPQLINHWEGGRPISKEALLTAQEIIGCDAVWLRDGTGEMVYAGGQPEYDLEDVSKLISLYGKLNVQNRAFVLAFLENTVKNQAIRPAAINKLK